MTVGLLTDEDARRLLIGWEEMVKRKPGTTVVLHQIPPDLLSTRVPFIPGEPC
jgi:hypothetical protein